jgi:hypothetical protein
VDHLLRRIPVPRHAAGGPLTHLLARAAAAGLFAFLASCSWFGGGDKKAACPGTLIAPDLDALTLLRPGGGTSPADIRFGVKLFSASSSCSGDKTGVHTDTDLLFVAARNDPDVKQEQFTYFVAIADAQQNILAKQNFTLQVEFAPKQNQMRISEALKETLPLRNPASAGNYSIIVGLQLTPDQVELNRKRSQAKPAQ